MIDGDDACTGSGSLIIGSPGDEGAQPESEWRRTAVDIVTILIIVILVLLAIYLFQRVF